MIARERLGKAFAPVDFHFADFVTRTGGMHDESIWIAALLTSANARHGHICLDLTAHASAPLVDETGDYVAALPDLEEWRSILLMCKAIGKPGSFAPLILDASRLYLYRYWRCENSLAQLIRGRLGKTFTSFDMQYAAESISSLFEKEESDQRLAVAGALRNSLCLISGGPGTGKTTTVARIVSLLLDHNPKFRIALSAPTGKAATRLQQALNAQAADLPGSAHFPQNSFTLHRLLGASADGRSFRHGKDNPLPFDAVIVDEASMVGLELMTRLFEAAVPKARIILLGDQDQLPSVEGGGVFGDLCRPPQATGYSPLAAQQLSILSGMKVTGLAAAEPSLGDALFALQKNYRFGQDSGIARLANAIRQGNADEAMRIVRSQTADVSWTEPANISRLQHWLQDRITQGFRPYLTATNPMDSFEAFSQFRVLCALHEGPFGVDALNGLASEGLAHADLINTSSHWYAGRPVLITHNDQSQQLYNGDTGIVLPDPLDGNRLRVFFPKADGFRSILPAQLPHNESAYAMTVHKTQGSEFGHVLLVLPDRSSPVLCRELVYTAVTRARKGIEIMASAEVLSMAIRMQTKRASGLRSDSGTF